MARTTTRTAPAPTPAVAWATVARWVATVAVFVGWVWIKAPARSLWSVRMFRVVAWCLLLPVAWWAVRVAVRVVLVIPRWLLLPVVAVLWIRVSARTDVRDAIKAIRKGSKRGRKAGKRVARVMYGPESVRS